MTLYINICMDLKIVTNDIVHTKATLSEPQTGLNKPMICFLKERGWPLDMNIEYHGYQFKDM